MLSSACRSRPPGKPSGRDTICALATPPGTGSLAVIRISGPDTLKALDRLFRGPRPSRQPSHTTRLGWFTGAGGRRIDQVMLAVFRKPRSYTGEDSAEITGHGSTLIADAILSALVAAGCRPARPGEFTRRAVLAGKMTVSQAEAVHELVSARTAAAHEHALARYEGNLTKFVRRLVAGLSDVLAEVEYSLGFDENNSAEIKAPSASINRIVRILERSIAVGERARYLNEGARVTIVGRTNVGKSSLFNRLVDEDRAIVTPLPGTTRDRIHAPAVFGGVPAELTDTAGLAQRNGNRLARMAAEQTRQAIAQSDLLLVVFDGSEPARPADRAALLTAHDRPAVYAVNKTDRPQRFSPPPGARLGTTVRVSCLTGAGISRLRAVLARRLKPGTADEAAANRRQLEALRACRDALFRSREAPNLETAALEIRSAIDMLVQVDTPTSNDAILDRIFAHFCVGK